MSAKQYRSTLLLQGDSKTNKYGAIAAWRCLDCGAAAVLSGKCSVCQSKSTRRFDSKAEAKHYDDLRLRESMGLIGALECQPEYVIKIDGQVVGKYIADFRYKENGETVVLDVKGGHATDTALSKFKRKCVKAQYGVDVQVVRR